MSWVERHRRHAELMLERAARARSPQERRRLERLAASHRQAAVAADLRRQLNDWLSFEADGRLASND